MAKRTILVASFLIVLSYSVRSRDATAEVNDDVGKHNQNDSQSAERIDKQVNEINDALAKYEKLSAETEAVINGLNNLSLYFVNLQSSLLRTKNLIANVSEDLRSKRAENDRLKEFIGMDKSKVNAIIDTMDEEKKWWRRSESYIINIIAAITSAIAGYWYRARRSSLKE